MIGWRDLFSPRCEVCAHWKPQCPPESRSADAFEATAPSAGGDIAVVKISCAVSEERPTLARCASNSEHHGAARLIRQPLRATLADELKLHTVIAAGAEGK